MKLKYFEIEILQLPGAPSDGPGVEHECVRERE